MRSLVLALSLLLTPLAAAEDWNVSTVTHMECMRIFIDGPAAELHEKMRPLARTEGEWEVLVSMILETFHVSCFALNGVPDNRVEEDQMPWVSPGMVCRPQP